ncbi:MAG: hypothetical protein ACOCP7_02180 [Desulfohalobiaceae bacterium]
MFEFFYPFSDDRVLLLSEAIWVPEDFFDFELDEKQCPDDAG